MSEPEILPTAPEKPKKKMGRPRTMTPHIARKVFLLAGYGMTDVQIGEVLGISHDTITKTKKDVDFNVALKQAKDFSDLKVLNSLYMLATGHDYEEEEIATIKDGRDKQTYEIVTLKKHQPPNVMACMYWLNNRQRDKWRKDATAAEENKTRPTMVRLFSKINGQEAATVRASGSQVDVLLGPDYVAQVKGDGPSAG